VAFFNTMTLSLSVFSYIHLCLTMVIAIKLLFYYFTKSRRGVNCDRRKQIFFSSFVLNLIDVSFFTFGSLFTISLHNPGHRCV